MTRDGAKSRPVAARFRLRLLAAMMVTLAAVTGIALALARRSIADDEELGLEREFTAALATLHRVRELRHASVLERSQALAQKSRIRAALEDGALDLLYLSARDELRDVVETGAGDTATANDYTLGAHFYRFLDVEGRVIAPDPGDEACGRLSPAEERGLQLPRVPDQPQTGFLSMAEPEKRLREIVAVPIHSSETGQSIAALVLGFTPVQLTAANRAIEGFASGIWLGGQLHLPSLQADARERLLAALQREDASKAENTQRSPRFLLEMAGEPHLVFHNRLNPDSLYPPAHEVALFSLASMRARQRRVTGQILGAGAVLLVIGYGLSHVLAGRFSVPVARLAEDSEVQRAERIRAEEALETTSAELERAARFSADASHQLKTPVTVLRAGLEEMLARGALPPAEAEEVAALIHQTYRLSSVIEDLLLLSRLDAGQLKIRFSEVDLHRLIEASLDDLSASPDDLDLDVQADCPTPLVISGEKRYIALILQNLLENARKYNRPGGRIHISARHESGHVAVMVGNTTHRPIPRESQAHIFERFHRAAIGENIPGYGIGLNLARELARLHDGDLRLLGSNEDWTAFEVRFRSLPDTHAPPV